jgi:hypothetical protein
MIDVFGETVYTLFHLESNCNTDCPKGRNMDISIRRLHFPSLPISTATSTKPIAQSIGLPNIVSLYLHLYRVDNKHDYERERNPILQ